MTNFLSVGSVDKNCGGLPCSGPHLHVGVFGPSGEAKDPLTTRSFILNRILVGQGKTPLSNQSGSGWTTAYPITSGFGHRETGISGASTEHEGADFPIGAGTQIAWNAQPGDIYTPNKGFGSIQTTDPQGRPYTVKFLHILPGSGAATQAPQQANLPSAKTGNTYNFYLGTSQAKDNPDFLSFLNDYMLNSLNFKSNVNPVALLKNVMFQTPDYFT